MPKVSVLMSVYNDQKYLGEAVRSILSQTLTDFEFIIFDDGSTDGSSKILDDFAASDCRIKIIHQANIGLTKTLGKGIELAEGEYVARMDADDIAMPERLMKQVKYLDDDPQVVLVSSFAKVIDGPGNEIGEHRPATTHERIRKLSFFSGQLCHPAAMFRKQEVLSLGGYDEDMRYAQDADLWFRVMKKYRVANIPEYLLKWRKTPEGIGAVKYKEQLAFAQKAKARAIKSGLYPKYYYIFLLWPHIRRIVPVRMKKFFKKMFR